MESKQQGNLKPKAISAQRSRPYNARKVKEPKSAQQQEEFTPEKVKEPLVGTPLTESTAISKKMGTPVKLDTTKENDVKLDAPKENDLDEAKDMIPEKFEVPMHIKKKYAWKSASCKLCEDKVKEFETKIKTRTFTERDINLNHIEFLVKKCTDCKVYPLVYFDWRMCFVRHLKYLLDGIFWLDYKNSATTPDLNDDPYSGYFPILYSDKEGFSDSDADSSTSWETD